MSSTPEDRSTLIRYATAVLRGDMDESTRQILSTREGLALMYCWLPEHFPTMWKHRAARAKMMARMVLTGDAGDGTRLQVVTPDDYKAFAKFFSSDKAKEMLVQLGGSSSCVPEEEEESMAADEPEVTHRPLRVTPPRGIERVSVTRHVPLSEKFSEEMFMPKVDATAEGVKSFMNEVFVKAVSVEIPPFPFMADAIIEGKKYIAVVNMKLLGEDGKDANMGWTLANVRVDQSRDVLLSPNGKALYLSNKRMGEPEPLRSVWVRCFEHQVGLPFCTWFGKKRGYFICVEGGDVEALPSEGAYQTASMAWNAKRASSQAVQP